MDTDSDDEHIFDCGIGPTFTDGGSGAPTRRGRTGSDYDEWVSDVDVEAKFDAWKESLAEMTGEQDEVLEELLLANVREYGWETGAHVQELMVPLDDGKSARTARCALYTRARLVAPTDAEGVAEAEAEGTGPCSVEAACPVCLEGSGDRHLVSEACGHRLHAACLANGLRHQLAENAGVEALRCPGCPAHRCALVPTSLVASTLGAAEWSPLGSERARQRRLLEAGHGSLFATCPSGSCRIRPCRENHSMQVGCRCQEAHRFCCFCGQAPHEPVPCAQMLEFRGLIEGARVELADTVAALPHFHAEAGSALEQAALRRDLEQANAEGEAPDAAAACEAAFFAADGTPPAAFGDGRREERVVGLEALRRSLDDTLGSRSEGALRRSAELALPLLRAWRSVAGDGDAQGRGGEGSAVAAAAAGTDTEAPHRSNPHYKAAAAADRIAPTEATPASAVATAAAVVAAEAVGESAGDSEDEPGASERLVEATTRPCPKCFIAIQRAGGCQHMTCRNPHCRHEFCFICLRSWNSPQHDILTCMGLGGRQRRQVEQEDVLKEVESRIEQNWEQQTAETRQGSQEDYAAEVRHRFTTALSTVLDTDVELRAVGAQAEVHLLHLSLRLFQLYERRERWARAVAKELFEGSLSPSMQNQRARQLLAFVAWLRARWWLRLAPEDAEVPSDVEDDVALDNQRQIAAQLEAARQRAMHSVHCLQRREADAAREAATARLARRCLERCTVRQDDCCPDIGADGRAEVALRLLRSLLSALGMPAQGLMGEDRVVASAHRALALAGAAESAWAAGRTLELSGVLAPVEGSEAKRSSMLAERWSEEVRERSHGLRRLMADWATLHQDEFDDDEEQRSRRLTMRENLQGASALLDAARKSVFGFALEYCGGTRRFVRRRAER